MQEGCAALSSSRMPPSFARAALPPGVSNETKLRAALVSEPTNSPAKRSFSTSSAASRGWPAAPSACDGTTTSRWTSVGAHAMRRHRRCRRATSHYHA
eukprot:6209775-Pleurochrysis_carterae.AAC.1